MSLEVLDPKKTITNEFVQHTLIFNLTLEKDDLNCSSKLF